MQRDWWWYCSDWTCQRFSFWPPLGFEPGTSGSLVLHSTTAATATSGFHLWQFQVFNSGAEGLVVILFWLDLWEIFFLATPGFEPRTSGSLVLHCYHCTMVTSGFHLWQFEVYNSGAEGLVVVLFWLDLSEIFFLANTRVWTWDLWISSPALYHCTTATSGFHLWQFQVFNSGAEGLVEVFFWLDLWEIFFFATPEVWTWDLWISSLCTLPLCHHGDFWFSSLTIFRYISLVQRDWWWYCSDWTCQRFSFWPHQALNLGPLDL